MVFRQDLRQQSISAKYSVTVNQLSMLGRVIIHKADGRVTQFTIIQQLAQQQLARVTGAVNQHPPSVGRSARWQHLTKETKRDATAGEQQQHYQSVVQENRARESLETKFEQDDQHADDRAGRH